MNTIKYILSSAVIATVMTTAQAQSMAQVPGYDFQSTSSMTQTGSTLPQAAVEGTYTTYDTDAGNGISRNNHSGLLRVNKDDDIGDPGALPIGEGVLVLSILGAAYGFTRIRKRVAK